MSKKAAFYRQEPLGGSSDDEFRPQTKCSSPLVDDNFLAISERLEEADIFVSASRNYIDATKRTINELKNFIVHAETDLNTADECVKETESRMQFLQQKLQAPSKLSFRRMFENSVSGIIRDMYFYASKSYKEYDENMKRYAENLEEILGGSDDFAARDSRLKQHMPLDNLIKNAGEVLRQNRYGHQSSRSCGDCKNAEKKLIPSGSRIFSSQNLRPAEEHSKTAFSGGEAELRNYDNARNDSVAASTYTGVNISSMLEEVHTSESPIGAFLKDQVVRPNRTAGGGHPLTNRVLPRKESLLGYVESNKVQPSKERPENSLGLDLCEKHYSDYIIVKYDLGIPDDAQGKEFFKSVLFFITQNEGHSSDDLSALLKERKDGIEDCNSEANLLNCEVCRHNIDASREVASSKLTKEIRLRNERTAKLLKNYQQAVPVNQPKSVYTSQESLTADFDGDIPLNGENFWVCPTSSKKGRSLKKDKLSERDLDTRQRDLNAKEQKLKSFLSKNPFCSSNSGEIKSMSHATEPNYLDIDYHSQKVAQPSFIHKNKSTNADLPFNGTLNIDTCISCTKDCVHQQDVPRVSEYFTWGSVSNSTRNENGAPNKRNSGGSSANSFENPSYISFYEDVCYPTLLWCEDTAAFDSNSKCSATKFSNSAFHHDLLMFEKKCSVSNCDDSNSVFLGTSIASVELECQTSAKSDY